MQYVKFENKNWGYRGDKGTWAAFSGKNSEILVVKKASNGIISSAYVEELRGFCADYDVDFDAIRCGERVSITVK